MPDTHNNPPVAGFSRLRELMPNSWGKLRTGGPNEDGDGDRGDSKQSNQSKNANAVKEFSNVLAFQGEKALTHSASSVPSPACVDNPFSDRERFARYLVDAIGGPDGERNMAFYRLVVRTVPRNIILDALGRTKDAQNIRKGRAQLFAFLVREHLPRNQTGRARNQPL
jgi:hypothetical protein